MDLMQVSFTRCRACKVYRAVLNTKLTNTGLLSVPMKRRLTDDEHMARQVPLHFSASYYQAEDMIPPQFVWTLAMPALFLTEICGLVMQELDKITLTYDDRGGDGFLMIQIPRDIALDFGRRPQCNLIHSRPSTNSISTDMVSNEQSLGT